MNPQINLEIVKEFALDVWEDLGRTRLASVAVGLGVALLAITVLVIHPAGDPGVGTTPPPATTATATAEDEVSFTLPGEKPVKMSDVDLSAPRDPFLGAGAGGADQTLLPVDETVQDSLVGGGSGGSPGVSAADYDGTSSLMPLGDLSGSDTTTTTDVPPTDSGGAGDDPGPEEPEPAPVTDYSYAADIEFGRVDDLKRYAQVQRLGLVPSRKLPLLMYLGVSTDHRTAVFMVDSRLSQGGEGKCVPKEALCTFLELRPTAAQDEHHFRDADGNEYLLRLRRLVRTADTSGSLSGQSVAQLRGTPPVVDGAR
jgi:hypothetical protein